MKRLTTALAVTAVTAASAQAALIIDHFDSPGPGQVVSVAIPPGVVGSTASSTAVAATALGGWRTIDVTVTADDPSGGSISALANDATAPDNYQYLSSVSIDGWAEIVWDANGAGLSQDLSIYSGIFLEDVRTDQNTTLTVFLTDGAAVTGSAAVATGGAFNGDLSLNWASFAGLGNLADIDRIVLRVNAPTGGDVAIHAVSAVPEPAETALAFAAIAGLTIFSRRFRV